MTTRRCSHSDPARAAFAIVTAEIVRGDQLEPHPDVKLLLCNNCYLTLLDGRLGALFLAGEPHITRQHDLEEQV